MLAGRDPGLRWRIATIETTHLKLIGIHRSYSIAVVLRVRRTLPRSDWRCDFAESPNFCWHPPIRRECLHTTASVASTQPPIHRVGGTLVLSTGCRGRSSSTHGISNPPRCLATAFLQRRRNNARWNVSPYRCRREH